MDPPSGFIHVKKDEHTIGVGPARPKKSTSMAAVQWPSSSAHGCPITGWDQRRAGCCSTRAAPAASSGRLSR